MSININDMTPAEKSALIDELMPCIVQKLMNTSSVIVNDGKKAVILPVRFLNSHQISTVSRGHLNDAIETAKNASTVDEKLAAVVAGLEVIKTIAIGNEG